MKNKNKKMGQQKNLSKNDKPRIIIQTPNLLAIEKNLIAIRSLFGTS